MNKRIREIAIEAFFDESTNGGDQKMYIFGEEKMHKFAQLIVIECIDIIAPYTVRMSKPGEEYLHPILEIKKHFGVEQ